MQNDLITSDAGGTSVSLPAEIRERMEQHARQSRAPNTWKAYRKDWTVWQSWAAEYGAPALPASPEAVAAFMSDMATKPKRPGEDPRKLSTLKRYLTSISVTHSLKGIKFEISAPAIRTIMKGIRREKGSDLRKAKPLMPKRVREFIATAEPTLMDIRDCAMLALGLAFASRRSELIGLDLEVHGDGTGVLEFAGDDGAIIRLLKGKTVIDKPDVVHIQLGVALKATRLWIEQAGIAAGTPLFRSIGKRNRVSAARLCDRMVSRIVKKRVEAMGLDPKDYSGHSLRSGSITASFEAGLAAWIIKLTSRHKSTQILEGYNEPIEKKKHALTNAIGL